MIKITKGKAPSDLLSLGAHITEDLKLDYNSKTLAWKSGTRNYKFDETYKIESVRKALEKSHHGKCCYSEAKFTGDYPHVEHHRPKGRVDDWNSGVQLYPGYFWLAYSWDNLFYCKQLINVSFKKNFFPLEDMSQRNKSHLDRYTEMPLLINPEIDDPREHIRFHLEEPHAHDGSPRGELSIELLGLKHSHFTEARLKKLQMLKACKELVELGVARGLLLTDQILIGPLQILDNSKLASEEFSSMAIDFLQDWPHLP